MMPTLPPFTGTELLIFVIYGAALIFVSVVMVMLLFSMLMCFWQFGKAAIYDIPNRDHMSPKEIANRFLLKKRGFKTWHTIRAENIENALKDTDPK